MSTSWQTWSPFQSAEVREICMHMTDAERAEASRRSGLYGLWVFATFAGPLSFAVVFRQPALMAVAAVLIVIHIACVPVWLKMQRRFLSSTTWATEHGVAADRLRLFAVRAGPCRTNSRK